MAQLFRTLPAAAPERRVPPGANGRHLPAGILDWQGRRANALDARRNAARYFGDCRRHRSRRPAAFRLHRKRRRVCRDCRTRGTCAFAVHLAAAAVRAYLQGAPQDKPRKPASLLLQLRLGKARQQRARHPRQNPEVVLRLFELRLPHATAVQVLRERRAGRTRSFRHRYGQTHTPFYFIRRERCASTLDFEHPEWHRGFLQADGHLHREPCGLPHHDAGSRTAPVFTGLPQETRNFRHQDRNPQEPDERGQAQAQNSPAGQHEFWRVYRERPARF